MLMIVEGWPCGLGVEVVGMGHGPDGSLQRKDWRRIALCMKRNMRDKS